MSNYIENIFDESGPIAKVLPGYEKRPEQVEMAEAIKDAISRSETLIVEAGTGVGKSFSYLIPIAQYTLKKDSVAVISTNTINLQEQIIHKDIPFLENALGIDFKAVLVKGRGNYLCLRRLRRSDFKQKDLFSDENEVMQFARVTAWSYRTSDGSLYDLDEKIDRKVWDMVSSDPENCMGKACPYFKACFFQNAREKIDNAKILVINHSLFFSNLAMSEESKSILPDYDTIVFDEAHSIENVATEHLGLSVSNSYIRYLMDLLFNPQKQKGILLTVGSQDSMEWSQAVRKKSESFFKKIKKYFESHAKDNKSDSMMINTPDFIENSLQAPLTKLIESLMDSKKDTDDKEGQVELTSLIKKISDIKTSLDIILRHDLDNHVYWMECSGKDRSSKVSINIAPVNIGEIMEERLYSMEKATIFTSATLSIDNASFLYFKSRLGIKNARELKLGSSFDYKKQVRMYIAKGMPNPNHLVDFARASSQKIKKLVGLTSGNAFVLFTSYSLMNMVYEELEDFFAEKKFNVLKQDNGLDRSKMLRDFKKQKGSILFGVDSFWQGVDVQGEALSNVIITKLPFQVPDHPITQARMDDIKNKGRDAFLEYSLPEAVLRFKQGFGRLIRSKSDTGIIAILDSRIIDKPYGQTFLNSIPECETIID
ncbi:MAG: helicase C-terminal domain-containing protein [Candidatus Omnitrophota bacterium]